MFAPNSWDDDNTDRVIEGVVIGVVVAVVAKAAELGLNWLSEKMQKEPEE